MIKKSSNRKFNKDQCKRDYIVIRFSFVCICILYLILRSMKNDICNSVIYQFNQRSNQMVNNLVFLSLSFLYQRVLNLIICVYLQAKERC